MLTRLFPEILKHGGDVNEIKYFTGEDGLKFTPITPLYCALHDEDYSLALELIGNEQVDVNATARMYFIKDNTYFEYDTALSFVCKNVTEQPWRWLLVMKLLERKANPNGKVTVINDVVTYDVMSVIDLCEGDDAMIQVLFRHGATPSTNMFYSAVRANDLELVRYYLFRGFQIDVTPFSSMEMLLYFRNETYRKIMVALMCEREKSNSHLRLIWESGLFRKLASFLYTKNE
jgi:hypothetical protein